MEKELKPTNYFTEEPDRVSSKKILDMIQYLKRRGYKIEVWKRVDKAWWKIYSNHWTWYCRSHHEAFNHLYPFYQEEKQKEYQEYIKRKLKEHGQ